MIHQRSLAEIVEDLQELRNRNFQQMSISDFSVFDLYLHEVLVHQPDHHPETCDTCFYYSIYQPDSDAVKRGE